MPETSLPQACIRIREAVAELSRGDSLVTPPEVLRAHLEACESCSRFWLDMRQISLSLDDFLITAPSELYPNVRRSLPRRSKTAGVRLILAFALLTLAMALMAWSWKTFIAPSADMPPVTPGGAPGDSTDKADKLASNTPPAGTCTTNQAE